MNRDDMYTKLLNAIESYEEHPTIELGDDTLNKAVQFAHTIWYEVWVNDKELEDYADTFRERAGMFADIAHERHTGEGVVRYLVESVYCELVASLLDELGTYTKGV